MVINFLDTSAVLNGQITKRAGEIYISPLVLMELEKIKNSDRDQSIKYKARQAVRNIIQNQKIHKYIIAEKYIERLLNKYNFLYHINDHRLICQAEYLGKKLSEDINFITYDGAQCLFAQQMPHLKVVFLQTKEHLDDQQYCGWGKYYPTQEEMLLLYSNPRMNVLKCHLNQFAEIYENDQLKDVLFWNGQCYRKLNYKQFTSVLGQKIRPRNLEQKMYLDLLQNHDVPVKLCTARFGTGKSYLALAYALNEIQKGRFSRLIFVKNNLQVKGAGTLGTLPGDQVEKLYPWLQQIQDHIGIQKFEELLETGVIEPAHLSTLRGRDLKNCIVLVDEAENLLVTNIQLLIGRIAADSEIIFCADIKQCDYKNEKDSGIPKMINRLKDNKLFGMVKLLKTERSQVAALADLMD